MSRMNQIREAHENIMRHYEQGKPAAASDVLTLGHAALEYADLLARLADGSAYDIGAKASFQQRRPDGKWERMPRMSKRQWRRTFKAGLDAALGLQEKP